MNKRITVLCILLIVVAGGVVFSIYKINTPEYVIYQTIKEIKELGYSGLQSHLTSGTYEIVDNWYNNPIVSGVLSFASQNSKTSEFKNNLKDIEWSIQDVLQGKIQSDIMIHFNYRDEYSGNINVKMVKEDGEWKINSIGLPEFDD